MSDTDRVVASAAELFDLLWESLADVLGTGATAIILRRAIQQAALRTAGAEQIIVGRNGLDYEYRVPEASKQPGNDDAVDALRDERAVFILKAGGVGHATELCCLRIDARGAHVGARFQDLRGALTGIPQPARVALKKSRR